MLHSCTTREEFQTILARSDAQPVLLMKHSTRCPISAAAHRQFVAFAEHHPQVDCWQVLVVEDRALSQQIAADTGVSHESPQVILFHHGHAAWHAAHYAITEHKLQDALASVR